MLISAKLAVFHENTAITIDMSAEHERHVLTDFEKGEIEGLRPYFSHHKIGDQLGIVRRTVSNFLQRADKRGSINNLERSGRPRSTSVADQHYIVHTAESETRVLLAQLHVDTGINVCEQTFRRRLQEEGIRKWRELNRPFLTKRHAAQRRKWAKAH